MLGASTRFVFGIDLVLRRHAQETAYRLLKALKARLVLLEVEHSGPTLGPPAKEEPRAAAHVVDGEFLQRHVKASQPDEKVTEILEL